MKGFARVVVVVLALVAFVVSFAGATAALDIYQPANSKISTQVQFEVLQGDTTNSVAVRLEKDGLIRNAIVFKLWARYKKLDRGIQAGVYLLRPSMSMNQIIAQLQQATPDEVAVNVPDGLRATQYPYFFQSLPKFKADEFLTIAKTGVEPDGTKLWQKYWYVPQPSSKVAYALEGYLYPALYYFTPKADATTAVEKMLDQFGQELCPGPASKPAAYIYDSAKCHQNAVQINGKSVFDLMRATYTDTKDDVSAIRDMLIVSSFTAREIKYYKDAPGVAGVYYNRYLDIIHAPNGPGDTGLLMGSDPSVEYARDNDNPPSDGKWWKPLTDSGTKFSPNNPYNTYVQPGFPPGAIANPFWDEMKAAITPVQSPYFYFVSNKCGAILYAKTSADFPSITSQMNSGSC